jgi:hypothetical protein
MGRQSGLVNALFRGAAFTPAITPVVKNENLEPLLEQTTHIVQPVGDVPCIPVAEEKDRGFLF